MTKLICGTKEFCLNLIFPFVKARLIKMYALMKILAGLRIYSDKQIRDRISFSAGVIRVDVLNGIPCKGPTFTPRKPWRIPSREETEILAAKKEDLSGYQTVGLIRLESRLADRFRKLGFEDCRSHLEIHSISGTDEYKCLLNDTITYYEKFAQLRNSS